MLRRVCMTVAAVVGLAGPISGYAACSFGAGAPNEESLQSVFDSYLGAGVVDTVNDCLDDARDSYWKAQGGNVVAALIVEIAGFANQNQFGIYDSGDASNFATVFDGPDSSGDTAVIEFIEFGSGAFSVAVDGDIKNTFSSTSFGFFLRNPNDDVFYSDTSLNQDGADHLYTYQGNGSTFTGGPLAGREFNEMMYLLAWEDLPANAWDQDYQDLVVAAENIMPVAIPLPASLVLMLSGFAAFAAWRRKALGQQPQVGGAAIAA